MMLRASTPALSSRTVILWRKLLFSAFTTKQDRVLDSIDETVQTVLDKYGETTSVYELAQGEDREALSIARHLKTKIQSIECRRCWMKHAYCYCHHIKPLPLAVDNLFVLMHHKEVGMAVDTAKTIFASFPAKAVIGGIPAQYQPSLRDMQEQMNKNALVLFPGEGVPTVTELLCRDDDNNHQPPTTIRSLILIDGTWEQARRLYAKYFSHSNNNTTSTRYQQVQLSPQTLLQQQHLSHTTNTTTTATTTSTGHQLRPHPIAARQIATVHALQLFLTESNWAPHTTVEALDTYQEIAKDAAQRQKRKAAFL